MDAKEAIAHINDIINDTKTCEKCRLEHVQLCEWVEKQVLKEPIQNIYGYSTKNDRYCPICKSLLNGRRKFDKPSFCSNCGQHIDWGE